ILDEIQTGIGRTGTWFAFQKSGIKPDAVAVAKGLAGGFPIGALVTFGKASELFQPGGHGSTFGGNPLATSVAMAVLEEIEHSGLIENASLRGRQIREFLSTMDHPLISEVRGSGLLIGVGLTAPVAKALASSALERGLIINAPKDHSIRICPPLIVGETEIESFKMLFLEALESVK
ncbi:MAG: aminotransferase class III-fold pyridoxal phosphate-dependent enzyme, partial [Microbacteriaceae bacterium]|nr:aminotransferase class III-fold pyridoxal phosphate-dependent enzyme [Microbacteriaceae bacterium]